MKRPLIQCHEPDQGQQFKCWEVSPKWVAISKIQGMCLLGGAPRVNAAQFVMAK